MINPVRYENPNPQPSPWAAALSGIIQGGAGQIGLQQQQAQKTQEDNQKYMGTLLTALAQQNRLNPAQAGSQGAFPFAGQNWSIGQAPIDYGNMKNQVEFQQKQKDLEDPDAASWRRVQEKSISDNLAFGDGSGRTPLDILSEVMNLRQGLGTVTPGKPATKGFFGVGAKPSTPATRKKITKNGIITETINPDGTTDSTPKRAPDSYGYVLGQEEDVPGKGKHTYIGNNKWQKL